MTDKARSLRQPPVRVVLFANNLVGYSVAKYLRTRGEQIAAVVIHPRDSAKLRDEIVDVVAPLTDVILEGPELSTPGGLDRLASTTPTVGVSAFFGYIFRSNAIALFPGGIVNVHSGLLPYNRGAHPNVWSIVDRTPAGATIHYIDEGVDTGDIVAQREVETLPTDTGLSLYKRLEQTCIDLFAETWPAVVDGTAPRTPQDIGAGTCHRTADLATLDPIDLDTPCTPRELIDRLRARSFAPHDGAYFVDNGRRIYLRLELYESPPTTLSR